MSLAALVDMATTKVSVSDLVTGQLSRDNVVSGGAALEHTAQFADTLYSLGQVLRS